MSQSVFYTRLLITTIIALGVDVGLTFLFPDLTYQWPFMVGGVAMFFGLTIAIYYSAIPAAKSDNKARLAQYVMVLTFVKMMLSLILVYAYFSLGKPPSRSFLFPFFVSYLCYTVYETIFLVNLSHRTAKKTPL
jgi:hypothetical protein